ncbi:hypothetical protein N300_06856, partial [Calypte anna]
KEKEKSSGGRRSREKRKQINKQKYKQSLAQQPQLGGLAASSWDVPLVSTSTAGLGKMPLMTGKGEPWLGPGSGVKPHTSHISLPRKFLKVQRAQDHFCSSTLRRRMWLRSGFWRGAS